ncbi:MAG: hypothetical protein ABW122_08600 [Ilumatobacteraceae bacterium]
MRETECVLLQAFLAPSATEGQIASLSDTAPFAVAPELIHPDGHRLLWQYVQFVDVATLTEQGLMDHRCRLEALPGVFVVWFDVASQDVELKTIVRVFNLGHLGRPLD